MCVFSTLSVTEMVKGVDADPLSLSLKSAGRFIPVTGDKTPPEGYPIDPPNIGKVSRLGEGPLPGDRPGGLLISD